MGKKELFKRKWLFRFATLLFIGASFFVGRELARTEERGKEKVLKTYLASAEYDTLLTLYDNDILRGNAEAFRWYEENVLGIDTNTALAGISRNCEGNKNYYNRIGTLEAYTSKKKRLVIKLDGNRVFVSEGTVSEVITTPEDVFYLDELDGSRIHRYRIETAADELFISEPAERFMLYGKYVFCLGKDGVLKRVAMDTKKSKDIANYVQRFFVADGLFVQSGMKIFKISVDGTECTELAAGALLLGADKEHLYYTNLEIASEEGTESLGEIQESYVLHAMELSTKEVTSVEESEAFIRAIYATPDGLLVDTIE